MKIRLTLEEREIIGYLEKESGQISPWIGIEKIAMDLIEFDDEDLQNMLINLDHKKIIVLDSKSEDSVKVALTTFINQINQENKNEELNKLKNKLELAIKGEHYKLAAELQKKIELLKK